MADTSSSVPETTVPPIPPPDGAPPRSSRSALLIVFLVVFIDLFGFGIVLPLLPRYGEDFLVPLLTGLAPAWKARAVEGTVLGLLMASFSAMQFFFAPVWGRLSDRVGRRPILLLGLVSSVVFYTLFGFASLLGFEGMRELGLALLFVSRLGAGAAGATLGTAQAVIADSTTPQGRSRGMALIGAAFGIGFLFGPLIGYAGLTFFHNLAAAPGFVAAGLSFLALVLGLLLLPETLRPGSPHARREWVSGRGFRAALAMPGVGRLILIFFLSTFAFAMFEPTLALLTQAKALGLSDQTNFLLFAYVGLVLGLAQGLIYRPLARRVREITFMWVGIILMAVGLAGVGAITVAARQIAPIDAGPRRELLALFAAAPGAGFPGALSWPGVWLGSPHNSVPLLVALMLILILAVTGFAFVLPSVQSLISRLADPTKQGEVLGVNQSANAMARILGPFFGVLFYALAHFLPFAVSVVILAGVLLLVLRLRREAPALAEMSGEASHAH